MKFRFAGKEKRLVFGSYPDTTLLQARTMRENAARLLRDGVDPSVHKVQQAAAHVARVGATFKTIAEDWLVSQDATWSKRYAQNVKNSFVQDVYPKLGHPRRPLSDSTLSKAYREAGLSRRRTRIGSGCQGKRPTWSAE